MTDIEQTVLELSERHRDVLEPLIERVNKCILEHDYDSAFVLYQNLIGMAAAMVDFLRSGTIAPSGGEPGQAVLQ